MKVIKLLLIFIIMFQGTNLYSQPQNFLEKPYLETTATYTTEVTPDLIYLNIQIAEKDTKGKVSIEELEQRMIIALKSIGIDTEKQLSVSDLSSDFRKYFLKKTDVLKSKDYVLIVFDAQTVSQIAKRLEQIDISNIVVQKTEYSKLEELKIELREKAILKAKGQATSMLKPLNQSLGKALFISDTGSAINKLMRERNSGSNTIYSFKETVSEYSDIGITDLRVQITVVVYFEIL